jgi:hypothetical protein
MADIVGLIASVLQLVSTVAQARSYIKDFRHAPQDQLSLLLEIESLETLVKKVAEQINRSGQGGLSTGLRQFEKPLIQLEGMMKRLTNNLTSKGISSRLTWPLWGKEDVKDGLDTIERFKSLLDVWLGMDIRSVISTSDLQSNAHSNQGFHARQACYQTLPQIVLTLRKLDIGLAVKDLGEEQRTNHGCETNHFNINRSAANTSVNQIWSTPSATLAGTKRNTTNVSLFIRGYVIFSLNLRYRDNILS